MILSEAIKVWILKMALGSKPLPKEIKAPSAQAICFGGSAFDEGLVVLKTPSNG